MKPIDKSGSNIKTIKLCIKVVVKPPVMDAMIEDKTTKNIEHVIINVRYISIYIPKS